MDAHACVHAGVGVSAGTCGLPAGTGTDACVRAGAETGTDAPNAPSEQPVPPSNQPVPPSEQQGSPTAKPEARSATEG